MQVDWLNQKDLWQAGQASWAIRKDLLLGEAWLVGRKFHLVVAESESGSVAEQVCFQKVNRQLRSRAALLVGQIVMLSAAVEFAQFMALRTNLGWRQRALAFEIRKAMESGRQQEWGC